MHMRYLVEDLMRDWVDGLDIWLHVDGWTGTSFCLTWALLNELRVRWHAGELLHQIMER
jgi:hypothetical protein